MNSLTSVGAAERISAFSPLPQIPLSMCIVANRARLSDNRHGNALESVVSVCAICLTKFMTRKTLSLMSRRKVPQFSGEDDFKEPSVFPLGFPATSPLLINTQYENFHGWFTLMATGSRNPVVGKVRMTQKL